MSAPRLIVAVCDICGADAWLGRQGNVVCTTACAAARVRRARTRASMRQLLADVRLLDPDASFDTGELGIYINATIGDVQVRIEDREDLDWITMDLGRSVA